MCSGSLVFLGIRCDLDDSSTQATDNAVGGTILRGFLECCAPATMRPDSGKEFNLWTAATIFRTTKSAWAGESCAMYSRIDSMSLTDCGDQMSGVTDQDVA